MCVNTNNFSDIGHKTVRLDTRSQLKSPSGSVCGAFERDDEVFEMAARWLGFYGDSWIKPTGGNAFKRSFQMWRYKVIPSSLIIILAEN